MAHNMDKTKLLFACDLDRTLIHSAKRRKEGDVCVEWLDGKELSFMGTKARSLVKGLMQNLLLVPVTTRSIAQYLRIQWQEGAAPRYAAAANGAILLENGVPLADWLRESEASAAPYMEEMDKLREIIAEDKDILYSKLIDGMYVFCPCADEVTAERKRNEYAEKTSLLSFASGRKLYFLPPCFTKGAALRRLRERFSPSRCIAAGDSVIDVSMLEEADGAFCPPELRPLVHSRIPPAIPPEGKDFTEFFLAQISSM